MSVPAEPRPPGAIPTFPFHELPATAAGDVVGDARVESAVGEAPDFGGLRLALEAAVRALRSFHEYVGVLERQHAAGVRRAVGSAAGGNGWSAGASAAPSAAVSMAEPLVPPREVFPLGELSPGGAPRAVLTAEQQAQLNAALAQAFAVDPPPVESAGPPPAREVPTSPFAVDAAAPPPRMRVPQPMPAPAALIAAAPPLPDRFSGIATSPGDAASALFDVAGPRPPALPVALEPPSLPAAEGLVVPGAPTGPLGYSQPSAAPPEASVSTLPFSPFQGLEPPPPPPQIDHSVSPGVSEAAWPTSPFFGSAQATTAPSRAVEPPPVLISTVGNTGAPALPPALPPAPPPPLQPVPAAPPAVPPPTVPAAVVPPPSPPSPPSPPAPAAAFPPIPDQGQVFNFAELLRANGQR